MAQRKTRSVLSVVGFALAYAGYFGDGIGFVGRFQGTGQKIFFFDRLRAFFWVNARGAEEDQPIYAVLVSRVNNVRLNGQVRVAEFSWIGVVCPDASDFGRCEKHVFRFLGMEKVFYVRLPGEIELLVSAGDEVGASLGFKPSNDCGAYEASVSGDVNGGGFGDHGS